MAKNHNYVLDSRYKKQQEAIKEICKELNLVVFYPNYHADKQDKNTVLIYTQEANEYNKKLPQGASNSEYKGYVCFFENSDVNGLFDLNWLNSGKIDANSTDLKEKIRIFIKEQSEHCDF